jgi:hypothetical protein
MWLEPFEEFEEGLAYTMGPSRKAVMEWVVVCSHSKNSKKLLARWNGWLSAAFRRVQRRNCILITE